MSIVWYTGIVVNGLLVLSVSYFVLMVIQLYRHTLQNELRRKRLAVTINLIGTLSVFSISSLREVLRLVEMPDWIQDWISKDRLVANKYRISKSYLRQSKRIQFISGQENAKGTLESFHYIVQSQKYGKYNVTYDCGYYHCNCPFFKHRKICSHILGVCQKTKIWPSRKSIFPPTQS